MSSHQIAQDTGGHAAYYKHQPLLLWSLWNGPGRGSRQRDAHRSSSWSHTYINQTNTRRHAGQLPRTWPSCLAARPARDTGVCRHQAPPTRRLTVFLISKPNTQKRQYTIPPLLFHTRNKLMINQHKVASSGCISQKSSRRLTSRTHAASTAWTSHWRQRQQMHTWGWVSITWPEWSRIISIKRV